MTENEIVGWYQGLNGHEFEQTPGDGERQGSLECCSPWDHRELDMTQQLNNSNKYLIDRVKNPQQNIRNIIQQYLFIYF